MYINTDQTHGSSIFNGSAVEEKTINLIVIDNSFDNEQQIVSGLRHAGYTARSIRAEDEEDLTNAVKSHQPDLVIYFYGTEDISLQNTCDFLAASTATKLCRIIAAVKNTTASVIEASAVEAIKTGAIDLISFDNLEYFFLVIAREFESLTNARKTQALENALRETETRCNSLLDSSRDAIAYIHEGMHIYSNQSYLELFGIDAADELEGMPVLDMIANDYRETFKKFLRDYVKNETGVQTLQTQLHKPDGIDFEGEMELSPAHIDNEPCIQIIIRQQKINAEELEEQLKQLSQKDQLTGIYNRQYCIERLQDIIPDCEKHASTAFMMIIQLDNFADIKETIGISDADKYITAAAEVLNKNINHGDVLGHYTHSSFCYIAYNCDQIQAEKLAVEFQHIINDLVFRINGNSINTTCCIGATLIDSNTPEYNSILVRAEKALQEATEKGADQTCIHKPEKGELTRHEIDNQYKQLLTNALKNDDFVLHFQPVVSLHGDTNERYEVFVRLYDTNKAALIMPLDFMPAAEHLRMSIAIDRWVLYQTIKHVSQRCKLVCKPHFFIKLSAASLKDETLISWLTFQAKEKSIPPYSLSFVVKETIAVTNLKHTRELSQQLQKLQFGFVLDDFGSGTNPLQLLQHIQVDYVRLAPVLMEDLTQNTQHLEDIKNIAERVTELGKFTIAQQVPDATSLSILWGMGINFIQGNFLQEPAANMDYDFTEISS